MKSHWLFGINCLLAGLCLVSCTNKQTRDLLKPSEALGTVLAEEAVKFAGANKNIAIIVPDANWGAPSTVDAAFRSAVKAKGYTIVVAKSANLGDPMSPAKVGLRADDFLEAVQNSATAGAIVSIAGSPRMDASAASQLKADHPPIIVVATARLGEAIGLPGNRKQLGDLIEAKVIQEAIVDGAPDAGGAPAAATDPVHSQFDQNFEILRLR